jgi:arylformamidase
MHTLYRDFSSQAQIDAQYNPSLHLEDDEAPLRHYVAQAQRARSELRAVLDVPYGPTTAETLDIFPADTPNAPVFIFIHGGYWRALSSREFSGVALGMHPRGITTVVVNYALCPWVSIDEITRQARAAVAWTLRNIHHYGGDPQRVAVGGHSAGGNLAAMTVLTPWERDYGLPANPLRGALLFSGLFDLEPLRYSYLQPVIQLDAGTIARNSPLRHVRPCTTPLRIVWGTQESAEFARQSTSLHNAWNAAGNHSTLHAHAHTDHFSVIHGLEQPDSADCHWLASILGVA